MNLWETKSGTKIYRILNGRSNVYLIKSQENNFLVDTGKTTQKNKLKAKLNAFGISAIDWLFLTHTHFDHCQNATFIQDEFKCKIAAGDQAGQWIKQGKTPLPRGTNPITKTLIKLAEKSNAPTIDYVPFEVNLPLKDEFQLNFPGSSIQLISTPGHSKDSISIIIDHEVALVGDTMFGIFKNSIFPPYADNTNELKLQWQKLANTNCKLFLPGHGKPIRRELVLSQVKKHNNE